MNEFFARWKTESPEFFKNIAAFGKWLLGAGGVLMATTIAAPETIIPQVIEVVKIASGYMVFGGGIMIGLAGLTVKDYDELQKKIESKSEDKNQ